MKTFYAALVLALGCSREPQVTTNTIAPADPRPAPTVTSTIGGDAAIATAGSPPPATAVAPGTTGHQESARFETYAPGVPIDNPVSR